jgi:Winged helix DNA-binding domain
VLGNVRAVGTEMTTARAVAVRMANQGLANRPAPDARAAALVCNGIQAQDLWASQLAVRARSASATVADVVAAAAAPTVVRTWLMRGTLHMIAADDLRWLVALIGPAVLKMVEPRLQEVGLTVGIRQQARAVLPDVLAGRQLTRAELIAALRTEVRGLPTEGQGPAHLTIWASASGMICRAGDQGKEATYALIDEFVPRAPPPPPDPTAELVRRYVRAFGPVTIEDFAPWSRLPISAARLAFAGLTDELREVAVDGRTHYVIGRGGHGRDGDSSDVEPAHRVLRLLPAFDSYLMGYRGRDAFLHPAHRPEVAVGGILYPTIVVDGVIAGTWRLDQTKPRTGGREERAMTLRANFFDDAPRWQQDALADEAADVGRFLGRKCDLALVRSFRN